MSYRITRPIPFGSRELPYQFRARAALAGLGVLVSRRRGLGDQQQYNAALGLELCNQTTVGDQYACEQRNEAKQQAYVPGSPAWNQMHAVGCTYGVAADGSCAPAPSYYSAPTPQESAPVYAAAGSNYNPVVSFASSRGGSGASLRPGDTWTIQIVNGPPGAAVTVTGGKNGQNAANSMGSTNSQGGWSTSGTITADQVGQWSENWSVGGIPAGGFTFSVQQPAATPVPSPASAPVPVVPQTAPTPPAAGAPQTQPAATGAAPAAEFSFSSIPTLGWMAIAGVGALFVFGGKRG